MVSVVVALAVSVLVRNHHNCLNRLTVSLSLFRLNLKIMWNTPVLRLSLTTRVYFYIPVWREVFFKLKGQVKVVGILLYTRAIVCVIPNAVSGNVYSS